MFKNSEYHLIKARADVAMMDKVVGTLGSRKHSNRRR